MEANWSLCNKEFTTGDLRLDIRDGLSKSMRDELDDYPEDYRSLTYENWRELMSIIKVKDEIKRESGHIKKIDSTRAASLSDSGESVRVLRRKKANNGVSNSHKSPRRENERHHGAHCYFVL